MKKNELRKVMHDCFKEVGLKEWLNKESVIFRLKSKYGDIFNKDDARQIYDEIYTKFLEKTLQEESQEKTQFKFNTKENLNESKTFK